MIQADAELGIQLRNSLEQMTRAIVDLMLFDLRNWMSLLVVESSSNIRGKTSSGELTKHFCSVI